VQFGRPGVVMAIADNPPAVPAAPAVRVKREKSKCDPRLVIAARELRDRWLEQANEGRYLPMSHARYEVSRPLTDTRTAIANEPATGLLPAPQAA
jgi:hypothetical protein